MELIASYRMGKTGNLATCEDFYHFNQHFAIVVDGVTSKSAKKWDSHHPGLIAAQEISKSIDNLPIEATAFEACTFFTKRIETLYRKYRVLTHMRTHPKDRFSCSVILYSHFHKEIWSIGDCQCLIDDVKYHEVKKIDNDLATLRSLYLKMEILRGKSVQSLLKNDSGRKIIMPFLRYQSHFQNSSRKKFQDYRYSIIDGFPVNQNQITIWQVPNNAKMITLASDGYPYLEPTLEGSEKALRDLIKTDPLLYKIYPATKGLQQDNVSFDDRCYLQFYT